jgi:hypothetical protein
LVAWRSDRSRMRERGARVHHAIDNGDISTLKIGSPELAEGIGCPVLAGFRNSAGLLRSSPSKLLVDLLQFLDVAN